MNIVIAPDSFKGSLTAKKATNIIQSAILESDPNHTVSLFPMADGGEGTIETILMSKRGNMIPIRCTGATGEKNETDYAIVDEQTAIIEYAKIAGLTQVPLEDRNPDLMTSYGLGEVMTDAIERGCKTLVIGLGGSATNDGGLGMLLALGMKAWDKHGQLIEPYGKNLQHIKHVSFNTVDNRLKHIHIKVASDVDNPLCGKFGASKIYGPQKGATPTQVIANDTALNHFSRIVEQTIQQSYKNTEGAGAAGGIGFALQVVGAKISSGSALVADLINLENAIRQADLVITGEGKSDLQTLSGKAPVYVATLGKKYNVPVILISGSLTNELQSLNEQFTACFSIINKPMKLETSMQQASKLLYEQTKQIMQLIQVITNKNETNHASIATD